ncbi:hypothetical protein [Streptomyces sp. MH60]|uniref:hypothetical protein n=1 Tax=Streptomyces sp. MH60 TaxID=1940758 RepID=UPI000CEE6307|nr:hypothetical protein [Streptomyces sp. MH60]PPS89490.1 hypothetical protein BZZ08_01636 [Streptomyces sp. MH60]
MPDYADFDAEKVAHGIRLGGGGATLDAYVGEALTVADLEDLLRPDLRDDEDSPASSSRLGQLRVRDMIDSFTMACDWYGYLPGHYETRDTALVAYGYILGGEQAGSLNVIARPRPEPITEQELERFARDMATS